MAFSIPRVRRAIKLLGRLQLDVCEIRPGVSRIATVLAKMVSTEGRRRGSIRDLAGCVYIYTVRGVRKNGDDSCMINPPPFVIYTLNDHFESCATMSVVQDLPSHVLLSLSWSRLRESKYETVLAPTTANNDSYVPVFGSETMANSWSNTCRQTLVFVGILSIPFIFNYLFTLVQYHWANIRRTKGQVPPQYPALPIIGSTLSFLWDSASFVKKAT